VRSVKQLNKSRPTVFRLELDQLRLGLPEAVIVKQQKDKRDDEFRNEILAYERLKELQGTVIPTLFGQGSFNGRPALILSEVDGITLRQLAETDVQEKTLETQLEKAIKALHQKGAEYGDLNLGNFLFCKNGEVAIVDLEEVEFPDKRQPWERSVNLGGVGYLMSRFKYVRNPGRTPTPPISWTIRSDDSDDKSALERAGSCSLLQLTEQTPRSRLLLQSEKNKENCEVED
jgi:serine/threonine protein kinase